MIRVLEGDSSTLTVGESLIVMGIVEDGWGFPVFILLLFLALKYMEACLLIFSFGFICVLRFVRAAVSSLSRVSRDPSLCFASATSFSPPFVSFFLSLFALFLPFLSLHRSPLLS